MTLPLCHADIFCWTHWVSCLSCQLSSTSHWHRWQSGWQLMYIRILVFLLIFFWPPYWTKTSVHWRGFSYTCVNVIVCITCSWYVTARVLEVFYEFYQAHSQDFISGGAKSLVGGPSQRRTHNIQSLIDHHRIVDMRSTTTSWFSAVILQCIVYQFK